MNSINSIISKNTIIAQLDVRMHYAEHRILHQEGMFEKFYTGCESSATVTYEALALIGLFKKIK